MGKYRAKKKTLEEWYNLILEAKESDLTDKDWCMSNNIKYGSFKSALAKLREAGYRIPVSSTYGKKPVMDFTAAAIDNDIVEVGVVSDLSDAKLDPEPKAVIPPAPKTARKQDSSVMEITMSDFSIKISNGIDPSLLETALKCLGGVK